jgi:hypothetical protein
MHKNHRKGGFVQIIIIVVIVLIVLGYLGYNVAEIVNTPSVQSNLAWGWDIARTAWNKFLEKPAMIVWDLLVSAASKANLPASGGSATTPVI